MKLKFIFKINRDQDQDLSNLEKTFLILLDDELCNCVIINFGDYEARIPYFSYVGRSKYPAHASTRTTPR